jgi:hypothetical protein
MDPYVANITGRISEVRAYMRTQGGDVVAFKRADGRDGYRVVEPRCANCGAAAHPETPHYFDRPAEPRPVTQGEPMALGLDAR